MIIHRITKDFLLVTQYQKEKIETEQIAKPSAIDEKNNKLTKFKWVWNQRDINTLVGFYHYKQILTNNLLDLIEFQTILSGFSSNKLDTTRGYDLSFFHARTVQKKNKISLYVNFGPELYFDKIEAQIFANKLNAVIKNLVPVGVTEDG
jgi:hypothetical protein